MTTTNKTPTVARHDEEPGAVYYASGSNHAGEIAALADLGFPVGVTVDELNAEALAQLEADEPRIRHLFVDSGAFGEVDRKDVTKVVRPIVDADWRERLATYQRLGEVFGSKMVAVAPDRVAHQGVTLARMSKYRRAVQALAATGCGILVPVQRGEHGLADFFKRCTWALGMKPDQVIPAFPMKKGATDPKTIVEFCKAVKPARVHLLGLGRTNPKAPKLVAKLEALGVAVTLDSCLITASVGKTNGRNNHPAECAGRPRILSACTWYEKLHHGLSTFERKRRAMTAAFSLEAQGAVAGRPVAMIPAPVTCSRDEPSAYFEAQVMTRQAEQIAQMRSFGYNDLADRLQAKVDLYARHTRGIVFQLQRAERGGKSFDIDWSVRGGTVAEKHARGVFTLADLSWLREFAGRVAVGTVTPGPALAAALARAA